MLRVGLDRGRVFVTRYRRPLVVGTGQIETGKDHAALRHARDHGEQVGDRPRRAGHPGRDDEMRRWFDPPLLRKPAQEPVAPIGQVDPAKACKFLGPAFDHRGEQGERFLPVALEVVRDIERPEVGRRPVLGDQFVERRGEFGCQPQRFGRADRLARERPLLLNQARQD